MDFFEEIAKYRAVRAIWAQLVRDRFGGTTEKAQHFRLHAATSGRPLTAQQPLNNVSRITMQILAQILGGCEQTRTASFDEALGIPTQEAARTSIRGVRGRPDQRRSADRAAGAGAPGPGRRGVRRSLARLAEVCATDENAMPAVLDCVRSYAAAGRSPTSDGPPSATTAEMTRL